MKKLLAVLCLLVVAGVSGCTSAKVTETPVPTVKALATVEPTSTVTRVCVTLGDSITAGYGLSNPQTLRYSARLCTLLSQRDNCAWEDDNYGVSGDDSQALLKLLNNGGAAKLKDADVVAVCIGANNVLIPAATLFSSYASPQATAGSDAQAAFQSFTATANENLTTLKADLNNILTVIHTASPTAEVVVMTVYNPFKGNTTSISTGSLPMTLGVLTESYVAQINKILRDGSADLDYRVADVYTAFQESQETLVNTTPVQEGTTVNDPHPNVAGHEKIAEVMLGVLTK